MWYPYLPWEAAMPIEQSREPEQFADFEFAGWDGLEVERAYLKFASHAGYGKGESSRHLLSLGHLRLSVLSETRTEDRGLGSIQG